MGSLKPGGNQSESRQPTNSASLGKKMELQRAIASMEKPNVKEMGKEDQDSSFDIRIWIQLY